MNIFLMPFLYFPEDKSEYIPAAISFFVFMVLFFITFYWIRKISKKQEEETRELEEKILRERQEPSKKQHPQQ